LLENSENSRISRRLVAILAADIAGYSALMGADEEATVRDLKAHQAVIVPMIGEHGGRIIDTAGDGILAEFPSVLGAVKCAVAIQRTMAERNEPIEPEKRMQYRIGINQGDVVVDDARVYGDGVNIAARLESIANPGGICVSGKVHDEIASKVAVQWEDLGPQTLKNISQPIRVYRVQPVKRNTPAIVTRRVLELPDKPSIAVLPFTNLSGDNEQEYFSDGITEDIITELSRFSELLVIASNSSFELKGSAFDVRQIGRELGVHYVLEGSIRKIGDHVRITAKLVDAITGAHRWAERYDREMKDVFAVQDDVARTIVSILAAHVGKAEVERTRGKPPPTWQAYDYYLQGRDAFASFLTSYRAVDLYDARQLLQGALSIDRNYARAHAVLSNIYLCAWLHPLDDDYLNAAALERAHQVARKAVQLDPNLPVAHEHLGLVLTFMGQHEESIGAFERATALNPNFSNWRFGFALIRAGEAERAIGVMGEIMRLDPFYPAAAAGSFGFAYYMLKRYADAVPWLLECTSRAPDFRAGHAWRAANHARLGQPDEAQREIAEVLRLDPTFTIDGKHRRLTPFRLSDDAEHFFDGLRKAGLPER
jgi:adenylate cyclase